MPRTIWKGAISFGLVNVPVALRPAARENRLDLDWLDKRDMAPVGYQRINKRTGKPIEAEHVVKGFQYEKGEYVLLSDEDFRQANVEATQTVDIVSFVAVDSIPPYFFETPYYLEPDKRGAKGYALLRETMRKSGQAALALVVLRNRQHLCAMLVRDDVLVLNTMRFADEVLPIAEVKAPAAGSKGTSVTAPEIEMAMRLVKDMSEKWKPEKYRDTYHDDLMARIDEKVAAGKTHELAEPTDDAPAAPKSAKIIDMMALLQESLSRRGGKGGGANGAKAEKAAKSRTAGSASKPTKKATASADAGEPATESRPAKSGKSGKSGKSAKTTTKSNGKASSTSRDTRSDKPTAAKRPTAKKPASGSAAKTTAKSAPKRAAAKTPKSRAPDAPAKDQAPPRKRAA